MFKGVPKKERTKRAVELLKAVGLSKHLRHKPTQMSGGQQQRVGIARAFVTNPEIVFADEPTGNLDSKTSMEVLELMAGLTMKNRQTLIMVTHDLNIAKRADRIIYILDGRIEGIEEISMRGLRMSKIKIVNILILLVLLISFNLETVNVFAGPNDIIIQR